MKARWDKRERDERFNEDEQLTNDELRQEKDAEHRERKLGFNGEIDFSKMRPTEFPTNKDLQTPSPLDKRTEIHIQTDRLSRMEVVTK